MREADSTNHCVHVHEFIEQHQFHSDECVVLGPHVLHIIVELTGHFAELLKLVCVWSEPAWVGGVAAVPGELVAP